MPGEVPVLLLPSPLPVAALVPVLEGEAWHDTICWEKEIMCLSVWDSNRVQDNP